MEGGREGGREDRRRMGSINILTSLFSGKSINQLFSENINHVAKRLFAPALVWMNYLTKVKYFSARTVWSVQNIPSLYRHYSL